MGLRAIQVDGGSELYAEFEDACKLKGMRLFVLLAAIVFRGRGR